MRRDFDKAARKLLMPFFRPYRTLHYYVKDLTVEDQSYDR